MKYKGMIKKSRTLDAAGIVAALGVAIETLPMLKDMLAEHYGLVFVGVSMLFAYLRAVTTKPLDQKDE